MLSFIASNAQIKNAKTESVKIYGNCGMCETTIEKAGNLKKTAEVDWNKRHKNGDHYIRCKKDQSRRNLETHCIIRLRQ